MLIAKMNKVRAISPKVAILLHNITSRLYFMFLLTYLEAYISTLGCTVYLSCESSLQVKKSRITLPIFAERRARNQAQRNSHISHTSKHFENSPTTPSTKLNIPTMATQGHLQSQPEHLATSLTIRDPDLAHALEVLRSTPTTELFAVRNLCIRFEGTNLLHWHGTIWPGVSVVFDEDDMTDYARLYPAPPSPPREAFRQLLLFIVSTFDLQRLNLEICANSAAWGLFEDMGAAAYGRDEVDDEWRFIYEFFLDVGRVLFEVFNGRKLKKIHVETSIWDDVGPWLDAQITGEEPVLAIKDVPRYHTAETRLVVDKS